MQTTHSLPRAWCHYHYPNSLFLSLTFSLYFVPFIYPSSPLCRRTFISHLSIFPPFSSPTSPISMDNRSSNKRLRVDSPHSESDSPEVKRLREDLLGLLDDADPDPTLQDLDSVIQSFADEISPVSSATPADSLPELGYLLLASDDELGLPPSDASTSHGGETEVGELTRASSESSGIGEIWGFEDAVPNYEAFELGEGERFYNDTEYVAFDGLFEHSDVYSVFS